jgi:predicted small lipoprotein YifL
MEMLRRRLALWATALAALLALTGCGERLTGGGPPATTEEGEDGEDDDGDDDGDDGDAADDVIDSPLEGDED